MLEKLAEVLASAGLSDSFAPISRFLIVLINESDRGMVLAGAAFIDSSLESLLRAFLTESTVTNALFTSNGPLSTFSSRNNMALSLGLIDSDIKRDIDLVRKIRNRFAHTETLVSLKDSDAANRLNELVCLKDFTSLITQLKPSDKLKTLADTVHGSAKVHFLTSIGILLVYLSDAKSKFKQREECENHCAEWKRTYSKAPDAGAG